jgi:hypothetical protein
MSVGLPDLTTAPPWHLRDYQASPEELADWLAVTSKDNRDWWIKRAVKQLDIAHDCLIRGHEEQIDNLRNQLKKERERVAFLGRNYGEPM